jgi:broad specificity phosphatase PhoE
MKLYLIRHGESIGNAAGVIQGQADYRLTERGIAQARATAERLRSVRLDALYASPLSRALQTAEIIGEAQGLAPIVLRDVQEYHFGEGTGLTFQEWRRSAAVDGGGADPHRTATPLYPGEEGREQFRERVCAAIWGVCERHRDDHAIAIVAHAGPIAVFVLDVLGVPYRRPVPMTIENCSISRVDMREGRNVIDGLNDTCHLEGIATPFNRI